MVSSYDTLRLSVEIISSYDRLRWSGDMISCYHQLRLSVETISSYDGLRWSVGDDDQDNGVQEHPTHLSTGPYSGQPDYSCYNHHR